MPRSFHLYLSDVYQNPSNKKFKNEAIIDCADELKKAVSEYDYTPYRFFNFTRGSGKDPERIDCIILEFDNLHSENPAKWVTPKTFIEDILKDIECYFFTTKSHMIEKDGKAPRPKFRVLFPVVSSEIDPTVYLKHIENLLKLFPMADRPVAIDLQRLYYANDKTKVIYHEGSKIILDLLGIKTNDFINKAKEMGNTDDESVKDSYEIPEGNINAERNTALKKYAGHIKLEYVNREREELFDALWAFNLEKNVPPLDEKEVRTTVLASTWKDILKIQKANEEEARPNKEKLQYKFNDVGTSEYLRDTIGNGLRYCAENQKLPWYFFKGGVWLQDKVNKAHGRAREAFRKWAKEVFKIKDEVQRGEGLTWLGKLTSYDTCERVLKETRHLIPITSDYFDTNDNLINFQNGTLDVLTNSFYLHNREEYHTKITNCNYDPSCKPSDLWLEFIDFTFDKNRELIDYIQKILGLATVGKSGREEFFILHGQGQNGKSQLIAVFQEIFGNYTAALGAENVMESKFSNNATYLARLRNIRTLFCSESKENAYLDVALVKRLTDSSMDFTVADKYQCAQSFKLKLTPFLITNNRPIINEMTNAVWRRIKLIYFGHKVPDEKRILKYAEVLLKSGKEGICNWFLEGYFKAKSEGIKEPECVKLCTEEYKTSSDYILKFINDMCETNEKYCCKISELRSAFLNYAGIKKYRLFEEKMNEKGFPSRHKENGNNFLGIRLKEQNIENPF